ncbi:hypothetical protein [Vibrio parahaemolyticus]|uniref:hypothetical protein n=1 Tax=Vibrio parahaemolyticus TaxID=670 RepID=UPI002361651D|nr:hypothetical protein [Vibrio parahaemolyticus]
MKILDSILLLLLVAYLSGCSGLAVKKSDPFELQFEPIASTGGSKSEYLSKATRTLEDSGYSVTPNEVFFTATTLPKKLGTQRWRANGEKWRIQYQLSIQIIEDDNDTLYWKLSHKIIGKRSGREPRLFYPEDFEVTEEMINVVHQKMSIAFRRQA